MWGIGRKIKNELWLRRPRHVVKLTSTDRPNTRFSSFATTGEITIPKQSRFRQSDIFFTLGSCFAEEIRLALVQRQIECVPKFRDIVFDSKTAVVDELPEREHMNFYNTFTVRLQLEQMLGLWKQEPDDYWKITRTGNPWDDAAAYQDPYRRLILAKTPEILSDVISDINRVTLAGFKAASAFIFTFGMTEVFVNRKSGKVVAQKPSYKRGGGADETDLHISTFQENLDNVRTIVDLVRSHKPTSPVILTVSPVALSRTFQDNDIVVVNTESKSVLRAVLGQVSRERENVIYLPSYDFVTACGYERSYEIDKRHVRRPVVSQIVDRFFEAHFEH